MPCSLARSLPICWIACAAGLCMLLARLDTGQLPYASGLFLCALDELRGAFLANYSPGARNPLAGRLRVGSCRSIDCMRGLCPLLLSARCAGSAGLLILYLWQIRGSKNDSKQADGFASAFIVIAHSNSEVKPNEPIFSLRAVT